MSATAWVIIAYTIVAVLNTLHIMWKARPADLIEAAVAAMIGIMWPISIPLFFWARRRL